HQHRANLLRGRTKILAGWLVGLEHVAERDTLAATLVDEEVLLGPGDWVRVARRDQLALHSLLDRCGSHLPRIAERLQGHHEPAFVHAPVLPHDPCQDLLFFHGRDARDSDGHYHLAPPPEVQRAVDAREQYGIAHVIGRVLGRSDRDLFVHRGGILARQTRDRGRRGRADDLTPGKPFALTQESRPVKL